MAHVVKFGAPTRFGMCVHLAIHCRPGESADNVALRLIHRARFALNSNSLTLLGHYRSSAQWTKDIV